MLLFWVTLIYIYHWNDWILPALLLYGYARHWGVQGEFGLVAQMTFMRACSAFLIDEVMSWHIIGRCCVALWWLSGIYNWLCIWDSLVRYTNANELSYYGYGDQEQSMDCSKCY